MTFFIGFFVCSFLISKGNQTFLLIFMKSLRFYGKIVTE